LELVHLYFFSKKVKFPMFYFYGRVCDCPVCQVMLIRVIKMVVKVIFVAGTKIGEFCPEDRVSECYLKFAVSLKKFALK
jgi:hypothetical protein